MKIMFMGTPDFAEIILRKLYENKYDICAVVTQTDKPKGRGYSLQASPVKKFAAENQLAVYQPSTLKSEDFAELLIGINPDLIIVAAYGKILPRNVIDFPRYGCINVHGSLLPEYRGAAPIQRAVINGDRLTGVTIMRMDEGVDTGDMYLKGEVEIADTDNFETIHDKLAELGAVKLMETLELLKKNKISPVRQNDADATYAPKIEKEDCVIDFSNSADAVHNQVRGLSPFPLAFTELNDMKIKIIKTHVIHQRSDSIYGTVISLDEGTIKVACGENVLCIDKLLPEGKKRMTANDFINGRKIKINDRFS